MSRNRWIQLLGVVVGAAMVLSAIFHKTQWLFLITGGFLVLSNVFQLWVKRRMEEFEHRRANGLCVKCGYDLRASEVRCPECGTPIPANYKSAPISD